MENSEHHELLICQCNDIEHQVVFSYDEDPEWNEVFMTIHLCDSRSFWERLVLGIKYIFGYKCRYGHFSEFIFKPKDWEKLQKITDYLKKTYDTEHGD